MQLSERGNHNNPKGSSVELEIKNWKKYQHYKDRNPPWIKLHWELLTSMDWVALDDASRVLAVACMLIASRNEGRIRADSEGLKYLERVAHLNSKPNLKPLIDCGFFVSASGVLAECYQSARPEEETETQKHTETTLSGKPDPIETLEPNHEKPNLAAKAKAVLQFLNEKTGRAYEPVDSNLKPIVARMKEGATEAHLRQVIAKKCREWGADEKMEQYLRPKTLFNATNFANYKGELVVPQEPSHA